MAGGRAKLRHVVRLPPGRRTQVAAIIVLGAIAVGLAQLVGVAPVMFVSVFMLVSWLNIVALRKKPPPSRRLVEVEHDATLGADGLALADRFVPRAAIAKIEVDAGSCVVTTEREERIELRGTPLELARAARFATAMAEAELPRDADGELLLTRVDVGRIRSEAAGYRGFSLDEARCLAIAEDPRAETRARIAAAEILRDQLDEAGRARVAEAADETAHEEVRQALLLSAGARARR